MNKKKEELAKVKYPSARLTGMSGFVEFLQQPGWRPARIDADLLKKMGVGTGKEGLVIQTLRFLGAIDEHGAPTIVFDELKANYRETMRRQVQKSYADLLTTIPAGIADQKKLVSFFSNCGFAVETAEYQSKLFVWLCQQSGIELPKMESKFHRARFDKKHGDAQASDD